MTASCPSKGARFYSKVVEYVFKFEPSKLHTYWSTQATMQLLVVKIIVPYQEERRTKSSTLPVLPVDDRLPVGAQI
jgi:hypothetical protein